jgi:hypothetical protein
MLQIDVAEHPVHVVVRRYLTGIQNHSNGVISTQKAKKCTDLTCCIRHHSENQNFEPPVLIFYFKEVSREENICKE